MDISGSVGVRLACFVRRLSLAVVAAPLAIVAGELDVAKEALRDGLWDVARTHALKVADGAKKPAAADKNTVADGDVAAAREVIAESYAREAKWKELIDTVAKWGNPDDDALVYYRALALVETGKSAQAGFLVSGRKFAKPAFSRLGTRLLARIAMAEKGAAEALKVVKSAKDEPADEDSEMFAAGLMSAAGDRAGAEEIWRDVVSRGTNAGERAFAVASVNLGDEKLLREAFARSVAADTRRLAGYGLGRALIAATNTLDEGAAHVRALVREAPDAPGAREALAQVAEAYLAHSRPTNAVAVYRETFETWPDAAKSYALQDGLGWALESLGRHSEALESFARAEETATTDAERAKAIVKQGDVLAAAGKSDEALVKYRSVISKFPGTAPAESIKDIVRLRDLEDKGRELYGSYRFAEAHEAFRQVAENDESRRPLMMYFEAMCLYGQGLDDDAESAMQSLTSDASGQAVRSMATLWLAKHAYNRRAWGKSQRLFEGFADMAPDSPDAPEALVWAARAAFAENDYDAAIRDATRLAEKYPKSASSMRGLLVQGEALMELARFDEAVLVLERVALADGVAVEDKFRARLLGADALFAMGADNPVRYQEALEKYREMRVGEITPSQSLSVSYKIAKTLEKLKRTDEAIDRYYTDVVLAYREARGHGVRFDDEARAAFSRAAFRLADEHESRGKDYQAVHILELVVVSDVPAAKEASERIKRIKRKGNFL